MPGGYDRVKFTWANMKWWKSPDSVLHLAEQSRNLSWWEFTDQSWRPKITRASTTWPPTWASSSLQNAHEEYRLEATRFPGQAKNCRSSPPDLFVNFKGEGRNNFPDSTVELECHHARKIFAWLDSSSGWLKERLRLSHIMRTWSWKGGTKQRKPSCRLPRTLMQKQVEGCLVDSLTLENQSFTGEGNIFSISPKCPRRREGCKSRILLISHPKS